MDDTRHEPNIQRTDKIWFDFQIKFTSEVLFSELVLENIKMNLRKSNNIQNYDIARG